MKQKQKKCMAFLLLCALLITSGTGDGALAASAKGKKAVSLAKSKMTLKIAGSVGKTVYGTGRIRLKKKKGIKLRKVTYRVKNTEIVRVSKKGKLTAKKAGRTKVAVTVKYRQKKKNKTAKLTLTVTVKDFRIGATAAQTPGNATGTPVPSAASGAGIAQPPAGTDAPSAAEAEPPARSPAASALFGGLILNRRSYATYQGGGTGINPTVLLNEEMDEDFNEWEYLRMTAEDDSVVEIGEEGYIFGKAAGKTAVRIETTDGSGLSVETTVRVYETRKQMEVVDDYYEGIRSSYLDEVAAGWTDEERTWYTDEDGNLNYSEYIVAEQEHRANREAMYDKFTEDAEQSDYKDVYQDSTSEDAVASLLSTTEALKKDGGEDAMLEEVQADYISRIKEAETMKELLQLSARLNKEGISSLLDLTRNKEYNTYQDEETSNGEEDLQYAEDGGESPGKSESDEDYLCKTFRTVDSVLPLSADMDELAGLADDEPEDLEDGWEDDWDEDAADTEELIKNYINVMLKHAGETDETERSGNVDALIQFFKDNTPEMELDFDEILEMDDDELMDWYGQLAETNNVLVTVSEAEALYPALHITEYLKQAGYAGKSLAEDSLLVLENPAYLENLNKMMEDQTSISLAKEYMKYEVMRIFDRYTKEGAEALTALMDADDGMEDFATKKLQRKYRAETENVLMDSVAEDFIGWDVDHAYTNAYLGGADADNPCKADIRKMTDEIKEQYTIAVQNSWMSAETKKNALEKLEKMREYILFPQQDEYQALILKEDLDTAKEGGTFVSNLAKILSSDMEYNIERDGYDLSDPGWLLYDEETEQWIYPSEVNAFYSNQNNAIYLMHGWMGSANYQQGEENYFQSLAMFGNTIAHEIGHAFDASGSYFDADGRFRDWWTEQDRIAYLDKQERLVTLYSELPAYVDQEEETVYFTDGTMTLVENMADLSGVEILVQLAVRKYPDRVKEMLDDIVKECIGTDQDEFEDSFEFLYFYLDTHAFWKVRANGVMSMLDEFYEVYDVKEGDAMYVAPEDRVRLWS